MPFTFTHEVPMFHLMQDRMYRAEESAPFASGRAVAAIHTITYDDEDRGLMIAVFQQLEESWLGGVAFAGCHLVEAGISVRRMLRAVRGFADRRVITADQAVWLKDQLASAAAEIEGERDPELCRIRALQRGVRSRNRVGELDALRAACARRMVDLKVEVLRRGEEGRLAALLDRDPAAYASLTEAGDRSVTRLITRRAA